MSHFYLSSSFRSENSQLEKFREKIRKQHEILTRENEKLARKLEQVLRAQGHTVNVTTSQPQYIIVDDSNLEKVTQQYYPQQQAQPPQQQALPRINKQNNYPVEQIVSQFTN